MGSGVMRSFAVAATLAAGLTLASAGAQAAFLVNSAVGGAPTGVNYVNFDNLALGSGGGVSGGVTVSFTPDGAVVVGALSGKYAPPYLSNNNGVPFGDPNNGPDTTRYLSTGRGSVTLALPGQEMYLGLLWGSVDTYNTLKFYSGANLIGQLTGSDVAASANGNQGVNGTYYVNINSDVSFDRVVASSSQYAFEFDNVAFNETRTVPEPTTLALFGASLAGLGFLRRKKSRKAA